MSKHRITVMVDRMGKDKFEVPGWVPYVRCPLAATRPLSADNGWHTHGWRVTHVATGMLCGSHYYETVQEAFAFIERLEPRDSVWAGANPESTERARELYKAACASLT